MRHPYSKALITEAIIDLRFALPNGVGLSQVNYACQLWR